MKKILICLLILSVFAVSGCATVLVTPDFNSETVVEVKPVETQKEEWTVEMSVENVTAEGLTVIFRLLGGEENAEIYTGSEFWLDIETQDGWQEAQRKNDQEIFWNTMAYVLSKQESTKCDVNWEHIYTPLQPGRYRIGKKIYDGTQNFKYCYAEFVIE